MASFLPIQHLFLRHRMLYAIIPKPAMMMSPIHKLLCCPDGLLRVSSANSQKRQKFQESRCSFAWLLVQFKSICTIGYFPKKLQTAYSFPCRRCSEVLLCCSTVKANQFAPTSFYHLVFQIWSIPQLNSDKVYKIKLCHFRFDLPVVGCSEVGIAAGFLAEAVGGGWLADSSNIVKSTNEKMKQPRIDLINKKNPKEGFQVIWVRMGPSDENGIRCAIQKRQLSQFGILQIQQQQSQLVVEMNKSIAKTRNELERITYKINQLKTKYTGQSYPHNHQLNIQNNPIDDSYQEQYSDQRGAPSTSSREHVLANRTQNLPNSKPKPNQHYDEVYHKEFKVFRNEIYNYVDKCLVMGKDREQEIIDRAVQSILGTSRGKPTTEREDRIRKVEEQTTNCLSSIQEVMAQMKKNEKMMGQRIACSEYKLKKQIKQISSKLEQTNLESMKQYIEQLIEKKNNQKYIQEPKSPENSNEILLGEINKVKELQQKLQSDLEQMKLVMMNWEDQKDDNKKIDTHLITTISETVFNQVKDWADTNLIKLQQKMNQISPISSRVAEHEAKLQQYGSLKTVIDQVAKRMHEIEMKQKQNQKYFNEQLNQATTQILQAVPETQLMGKQIQMNIETSYLKPRLEQLKRQLTTKFNQEIQFNKQDLMINVEETVFEKFNKFYSQEKQKKSPKLDLDESKLVLKQDLKDIQSQLKNLVSEQIQDKLEKHLCRKLMKTEALDTSLNISSRQKTLEEEHAQAKRTQEIIEGKLSEFETDINETIKLLYEDIENRVNQMLSHCGIAQIKSELEILKREMRDTETKVKSLTLIATTNSPPSPQPENIEYLQRLRSEVYTDMGCQIDKISNILQRTVEQMEGKVQKLDRNFSYIYERMSKIEYDNAMFKDQLALRSSISTPKNDSKAETIGKTSSNQLLEALGQYNAGRYFFES